MKTYILIPSLNPNEKVTKTVKELIKNKVTNILIVDDGSKKETQVYFKELKDMGCDVIHHKVNMGKGAALKDGMKWILKNKKDICGVVTADSDGQHTVKDIKNIANMLEKEDKLIIGTRDFSSKDIPFKSRFGNKFSSLYFKATTGITLKDTQTGLRGIPRKYFDYAIKVDGDRFEYEMNFLEGMKDNNIEFITTDIETVYESDRTTTFHAIKDSYRIYKNLVRNIVVALTSSFIDIASYFLIFKFIFKKASDKLVLANCIARVISGIYNFILNKIWSFEKKDSNNTFEESVKYLVLFVIQMFASGLLQKGLTVLIENIANISELSNILIIIIKAIIDLIIFNVNFVVMKKWVFKQKRS